MNIRIQTAYNAKTDLQNLFSTSNVFSSIPTTAKTLKSLLNHFLDSPNSFNFAVLDYALNNAAIGEDLYTQFISLMLDYQTAMLG